jgi:hypothetical protein
MSVYIAKCYPDRLEIVSDSAAWDPATLAVTFFSPKIIPIAGKPLVVTGRGNIATMAHLATKLAEFVANGGPVHDAILNFGGWLYDPTLVAEPGADLLVCGWEDGPFIYRSELDGDHAIDRVSSDILAGLPTPAGGFPFAAFDESAADAGVRVLRACQSPTKLPDGRNVVPCGGTVLLTTIRPDGISSTTLGGWPDLIGLPLSASAPWLPVAAEEPAIGEPIDPGAPFFHSKPKRAPVGPDGHRPMADVRTV